jgi:DeoR/GlpR family transcriptional regulator of sugar metabolism
LNLGRLMASSCRQKILEALSKVGQTHVMDLVRRVNSTYGQVNRNLQILEREGIVNIQYYGRLKMVKLNRENPKTVTLQKVLKMLKSQGSTRMSSHT